MNTKIIHGFHSILGILTKQSDGNLRFLPNRLVKIAKEEEATNRRPPRRPPKYGSKVRTWIEVLIKQNPALKSAAEEERRMGFKKVS